MRRAHTRRGQQGAAAVEFALVFPIVLILVFATIQWGLYFWADQGGSDAARNAARLSAVGTPTDCATFKADVKAPIDKMGNSFVITRSFTDADNDGLIEVGDTVTVSVTFNSIDLHFPFVPFISNGTVNSTAKARVEYVNDGQPASCS
jgi:Flp pilus assembly protein TadG